MCGRFEPRPAPASTLTFLGLPCLALFRRVSTDLHRIILYLLYFPVKLLVLIKTLAYRF